MGILGGILKGIGSIIGAGSQVTSSRLQAKTSKRNVDKTIAARKALAQKEFERNIKMWKMQNRYNSPKEQMSRFKKAGLNPNLIYGLGTAGNNPSYPEYHAPDISYRGRGNVTQGTLAGLGQGITKYQNLKKGKAQVDIATTHVKQAKQRLLTIQTRNQILSYKSTSEEWKAFQARIKKSIASNKNPSAKGLFNTGGSNSKSTWEFNPVNPRYFNQMKKYIFSKMKTVQLNNLYKYYLNQYEQVRASYAQREGIDIKDSAKVRGIMGILHAAGNALGYDMSWLNFNQANSKLGKPQTTNSKPSKTLNKPQSIIIRQ